MLQECEESSSQFKSNTGQDCMNSEKKNSLQWYLGDVSSGKHEELSLRYKTTEEKKG